MPKKLLKRAPRDRTQVLRRTSQLVFLALNVWIGVEFVLFVRYYETGGAGMRVLRPAGVEGWLPIASLMNLKVLALTGTLPGIHPAGTLLLIAFLGMSWLLRKSFCSWFCPVGTVSEYLARLGASLFHRNFQLPRGLDIALRSLKYLLLGFFVTIVATMPVVAIREFLGGPYGIVDDVRMLNFFREMEVPGVITMVALILGSVFVKNLWCRYLCPYGALMGLVALASPVRIRRAAELCIDCAMCAKVCPSALPVDRLVTIQSAECTGCMQCVAACPADKALVLSGPGRRAVPGWAVAAGVAALLAGSYMYGRASGHWNTELADSVYFDLVPRAGEFTH